MDNLDRGLIGIGLIGTLVLACAIPYSVGRECKNDLENLKAELSHAKRDATAAEIDAQTLARIKSIQERLDTLAREFESYTESSAEIHFRNSRRIDELESIIREPAPSPQPARDPVEPTTTPDVPATRPQPRRRFAKFRDLEEWEYLTDADGWWLVCLASIAVILAACVAMLYVSFYLLNY